MTKSAAEVVVVGAGPAGMAAATAASKRSRVVLLDDNSAVGGQIRRADHGKLKSPRARRWAAAIDSKRVSFLSGCTVVGIDSPNSLLVDSSAGPIEIKYEKLIVATGARERFLPF